VARELHSNSLGDLRTMAYIIVDTCTKDEHCIETCPVNCIHPTKDEADFATPLSFT